VAHSKCDKCLFKTTNLDISFGKSCYFRKKNRNFMFSTGPVDERGLRSRRFETRPIPEKPTHVEEIPLASFLFTAACAVSRILRREGQRGHRPKNSTEAGRRGAMEEGECAPHAATFGMDTLNLDGDDIEMAVADSGGEETPAAAAGGGGPGGISGRKVEKGGQEGNIKKKKKKRNKGKKKNKGRQDAPTNIADINR
jgi:hypothetical protein